MITTRSFSLGSEWAFLKIYVGASYTDSILSQYLHPISSDLYNQGLIDMYFFIRYKDDIGPHIRYRFHLCDKNRIGDLISRIYLEMNELIVQHRIVDIMYSTYVRELERYGADTYEHTERLFFYDSVAILELIRNDYIKKAPETRWMLGLALIDDMLDLFRLSDDCKLSFLQESMDGYRHEFHCDNDYCIHEHNRRYRDNRMLIDSALSREFPDRVQTILQHRKDQMQKMLSVILSLNSQIIPLDYYRSLIHMTLNRLFESSSRQCEMVLYEFLYKSFESRMARIKYSERNKYSIKDQFNQSRILR